MTTIFQFFITMIFAVVISSASGCASAQTDGSDQTVTSKNVNISLASKDSGETLTEFSDSDNVSAIMNALENKERRYEKLMPLFEYRLDVTQDGEQQVWYVNKAGYVRNQNSSELYKMDVSAVFE